MTLRATIVATASLLLLNLGSPSSAAANDVGWNPFLFIATCSTCGPSTPLTLEQADGGQVLLGGSSFGEANAGVDDGNSGGQLPVTSGHEPDGAPGVVNANGPGASAAPIIGIGVSVADESGNGLQYGLTLTNTTPGHTNEGSDPNSPNHDAVVFTLGDSPAVGGEHSPSFSPTQLLLADGSGSGSGSGQTLVPEPTSMMLFGTGLAMVAALARRRKRLL